MTIDDSKTPKIVDETKRARIDPTVHILIQVTLFEDRRKMSQLSPDF